MFLLVPLYTRVLHPADYGKLELVYLVGSILALFYGLRVENGYNRIFFYNKDSYFRKKLFSTGQIFNLFCALVFAILMLMNARWVAEKIFNFSEGEFFLQLIVIGSIIEVMKHIPFNNIRIRQKAKTYVSVSLFNLVIITSLTVYFVAIVREGVAGVLYAKIIGGSLTLALLYYITRHEYRIGFSFSQLKLMLGFSVFLIPSGLSALILNMSNRYFLQEYQTLEDVGLFSLGAKISGVIPFLFTEPVKKAFGPYLFEQIDNPEKCKRTLSDFSRFFFAGLAFIALTISLFSREVIMKMADPSYADSYDVVFILSISFLFLGLSQILAMGINITRKTWLTMIIWIISALVNIGLNVLLVPIYGRMGAAIATLISVIIISFLYFLAIYKIFPVSFEYKIFFEIIFLLIVFYYVGTFIINISLFIDVILKLLLILFFGFILFYTGIFKKEELKFVRTYLIEKTAKPKK
jgi:O-antigen/teichoic acid export membrane protein